MVASRRFPRIAKRSRARIAIIRQGPAPPLIPCVVGLTLRRSAFGPVWRPQTRLPLGLASRTTYPLGSSPGVGRSGEAEALADTAKGGPIKLYMQAIAGERDFIRTPGLSDCNPDGYDVPDEARSQFEPVGANY